MAYTLASIRKERFLTVAFVGVLSITFASPSVADISDMVASGALTGAVVDDVFTRVDQSMEKAKDTGDYVTAAALGRTKEAIKAWKLANADLLDIAFRDIQGTTQDILTSADADIDKISQQVNVSLDAVEHIMANADNIMQNLPLGKGQSYILNYSPRVIAPLNENSVFLKFTGVNLDKAKAFIMVGDSRIDGNVVGPLEANFNIPTSLVPGQEEKVVQHDLIVHYSTASMSLIGRIFGLRNDVTSNITVFRIPVEIAKYEVTADYKEKQILEKPAYETTVLDFRGRNTDMYKLAQPPAGWEWNMDLGKRPEFKVVEKGGEKGSCHTGIDWNDSTANGIKIGARVDEIKNLGMGIVKRKDGHVGCTLIGPIYKTEDVDATFKKNGTLTWGRDEQVDMPQNCRNSKVSLKMFNGYTEIKSGLANEKYYAIKGSQCSLILKHFDMLLGRWLPINLTAK